MLMSEQQTELTQFQKINVSTFKHLNIQKIGVESEARNKLTGKMLTSFNILLNSEINKCYLVLVDD